MNVKLDAGAKMPTKAHEQDAAFDLYSMENAVIPGRGSAVFDTGVHIMIPDGFAGVLMSKSGLNVNHHLTNTGLIDSGFTGSIKVKLYNNSDIDYYVKAGDKISQIMIVPVANKVVLTLVDELEDTERGDNGFGSSGR